MGASSMSANAGGDAASEILAPLQVFVAAFKRMLNRSYLDGLHACVR